jgi:calcineurin-like phosphoesterase family protein
MTHPPTRWRAFAAGTAAVLLLVGGIAFLGRARSREMGLVPRPARVLSLLAVGDTGTPPRSLSLLDGQRAVGAGLEREDRREPADALLLLGDNFYPSGLLESELVERTRDNLVRPYCGFVDLTGPRSHEVAEACPGPRRNRAGRPLYAVLGNHDWRSKGSPGLQGKALPQFIANWTVLARGARAFELGPGVSLVLFDSSELLRTLDASSLREALRSAPGPWRILAAHHPIGTHRRSSGGDRSADPASYEALVRRAVAEAGVDVQLMLAGHEHSLQLIELTGPGPRLVAIAGTGSGSRSLRSESEGRLFAHEGLGFARVDLLRDAFGERLAVSLYASPRWASLIGVAPELLARWSVRADGHVLREPIAERTAGMP